MHQIPLPLEQSSSGKTLSESCNAEIIPSGTYWQDYRDVTPPSLRLTEGGLTRVWLMDPAEGLHGGFSMLNITDSPNIVEESSFLQCLTPRDSIPRGSFLSLKAIRGMLRRHKLKTNAGSELPKQLLHALIAIATRKTSLSTPDQNRPIRSLIADEAERLQGFDGQWTAIPGANKKARETAIGNSMPVPVIRWIGQRIIDQLALAQQPAPFTYASICSGIEAATVAWQPLGCKPVLYCENDPFARRVLQLRVNAKPVH